MSDELIASMGPLPRTHGMLGAMLDRAAPYRTDDIHDDPRFRGWWPASTRTCARSSASRSSRRRRDHRRLLPDREGGAPRSTEADQALIELLAAHASIAITNARLYEHSRELSILSERNRLALELHDVVSQKLFSVMLTAEAAGDPAGPRPGRGPGPARAAARAGARGARGAALADPRPAPSRARARRARGALRKEVEMLGADRTARTIELEVDGPILRQRRRRRARAARCCGSRTRRSTTPSATPTPSTSRSA